MEKHVEFTNIEREEEEEDLLSDVSDDDEDCNVGTTNIVSIFGGTIIIAVDGMITSNDGLINREDHKKIYKLGPEAEIYITVCGGIQNHNRMQAYLHRKITYCKSPPVSLVAQWATAFLQKRSSQYLERMGDEPDESNEEKHEKYVKMKERWTFHYHNTSTFVCGFDKGIPKVYLANDRYEKALDISKQYTANNIRDGMTAYEISLAKDDVYPHHMVRGSYSKGVRNFMGTSPMFKRINDTFQDINPSDLDAVDGAMNRFSRDVTFEELSLDYAKALAYATMHDPHTGGDLIVEQISRKGFQRSQSYKAIQVYFDYFKELEEEKILFLMIASQDYTKENISTLTRYFDRSDFAQAGKLHAVGLLGGYVLFRLVFKTKDVESMDFAYEKVLKDNTGTSKFGMLSIMISNICALVGYPTSDMLKLLSKRL